MPKVVCSYSLPDDLAKQLEDLADAQGVSRSLLVERLLREGLREESMFVDLVSNQLIRDTLIRAMAQPEVLKALGSVISRDVDPEQMQLFSRTFENVAKAGELVGREMQKGKAGPKLPPRKKTRKAG